MGHNIQKINNTKRNCLKKSPRNSLKPMNKKHRIETNLQEIKYHGIKTADAQQIASLSVAEQQKYITDRVASDPELKKKLDKIFKNSK